MTFNLSKECHQTEKNILNNILQFALYTLLDAVETISDEDDDS